MKQEREEGNSGCVAEQVTAVEDHRHAPELYHLKGEEVVIFTCQFPCIIEDYSQQAC